MKIDSDVINILLGKKCSIGTATYKLVRRDSQ